MEESLTQCPFNYVKLQIVTGHVTAKPGFCSSGSLHYGTQYVTDDHMQATVRTASYISPGEVVVETSTRSHMISLRHVTAKKKLSLLTISAPLK